MKLFVVSRRALLLILVAVAVVFMIWPRITPRPTSLGVASGRLAPCPARPNCVCSQDQDQEHSIEPLPLTGTVAETFRTIEAILRSTPRVTIVTNTADYIHAECRSRWMGYIDDVEFVADPSAGVIHFRSASRLGYSDLGVNRKRMEEFRRAYLRQTHQPESDASSLE